MMEGQQSFKNLLRYRNDLELYLNPKSGLFLTVYHK